MTMKKEQAPFDYMKLVEFFLPKDILKYFEVTDIKQETTDFKEVTGDNRVILHIYLDERDTRDDAWHDLTPNGFTEPHKVNDFPVRDRKVILHLRRRRWLDKDGHNIILNKYELLANGTSYSKEFASVLKKIYGQLPDNSPLTCPVS
jgi:hypothetical protein